MVQTECDVDREVNELLRRAIFGRGVKVIYWMEDTPIVYDSEKNGVIAGEKARELVHDYLSRRREMLN